MYKCSIIIIIKNHNSNGLYAKIFENWVLEVIISMDL